MIWKYLRFYGFVRGAGFYCRVKYAAEFVGAVDRMQNEDDGSVNMEIQRTEEQIDRVILEVERGRYVKIGNMEARTILLKSDEHGFRTR